MEFSYDYGDVTSAQITFKLTHQMDCKWPYGSTEFKFHQAILSGNYLECRRLLKYKPSINLNERNERGFTPLQESLFLLLNSRHSSKLFVFLLKRGADYSLIDFNKGRDALAWSYYLGRQHEVKLIFNAMSEDVDYKRVDWDGNTYLHLAVISGCLSLSRSVVTEMKTFGISVDQMTNNEGLTPYLLAYRLGYMDISELLEQFGAATSQFDCKTFLSKSDWSKIGQKERALQQRAMTRKEKNQRMINGRLPILKLEKPNSFRVPSILLLTSDDKPAITGIDASGRNYTYQIGEKTPENSNLSKQLILRSSRAAGNKDGAVGTMEQDVINFVITQSDIRRSLPNIMRRLSIQRLPCYSKEVKPPVSAGETKGILKKMAEAKEKEAQYKQKKQRKSVAFARRRSSRLTSLTNNNDKTQNL